tara:strand:+ start:192 stop:701 length:510 start_codon:yes stop_codon:yes gene_type:complete
MLAPVLTGRGEFIAMSNPEEDFRVHFADDPDSRGYAAMDVQQRVDDLNASRAAVKSLSMTQVREWAAQQSRAHWIKVAVDDQADRSGSELDGGVHAIAIVAMRLLSLEDGTLNPGEAMHSYLIEALVAGNVITSEDRDALVDLATVNTTDSIDLTGSPAKYGDVDRASA